MDRVGKDLQAQFKTPVYMVMGKFYSDVKPSY